MAKKVGVKKNYQKQYEELQRDMQGVKPWVKKEYYRDFYRSIAKTADQRLVELERLSKKKGFADVTEWSYANAMRDIRGMFGSNAKRFNRTLSKDVNLNTLYKDINKVLRFLNAPTSSISGITEVYNKRSTTIDNKYGVDTDWSTIGHLFESKLWKKVSSKYGSKTALKAIGQLQQNKKMIKKAIKDGKPISISIPEQEVNGKKTKEINVEEAANKFLRYYKQDVSKILDKI